MPLLAVYAAAALAKPTKHGLHEISGGQGPVGRKLRTISFRLSDNTLRAASERFHHSRSRGDGEEFWIALIARPDPAASPRPSAIDRALQLIEMIVARDEGSDV
jgi:hypothetical protein